MNRQSPFPGMDPFLENPYEWPGVHADLIVTIRRLINKGLPTHFSTRIEGGLKIVDQTGWKDDTSIRPDIFLVRETPIRTIQPDHTPIATPITYTPLLSETITQRRLHIVDRNNKQVVTTIEIVSPSNKQGDGLEVFTRKREKVVGAGANWVEIDLLRFGQRINFYDDPCDYSALMIRANSPKIHLWPMSLQQPLLTIGIPLSDGYDDIPLNLQSAIEIVYRDGEYWRNQLYDEGVPPPKLSAENQLWVEQKLTEWKNVRPE